MAATLAAPALIKSAGAQGAAIKIGMVLPVTGAKCANGLSVADYGYVLETGRLALGGKPDDLWGNEAIRAAYPGGHTKATAQ